ncbi:hypothetical protein [Flavobacterium sp. N1994]|uniref:hypothetical protein n=1 Tax=Flavobacterium sp. N1994 TaxID=2986827 RepID=UPI002221A5A4|nr:hypothetical protein [Flavobacterium sp. N1994]
MKQQVTIDPSIAGIVNIATIGKNEIVPIYFEAEQNWVGSYVYKVWTTDKKTTALTIPETFYVQVDAPPAEPVVYKTIEVIEKIMTLIIAPAEQNLTSGDFYFEIIEQNSSRVVFKGIKKIVE